MQVEPRPKSKHRSSLNLLWRNTPSHLCAHSPKATPTMATTVRSPMIFNGISMADTPAAYSTLSPAKMPTHFPRILRQ